jgi:excisionase family DNA binding protein
MKKKYMTPNEVAQLLMVSPVTVRQWSQKGQLKAESTPGGHRRYFYHEIERFAREHGLTLHQPEGEKLRVLVVDDEELQAIFLADLFSGYAEVVSEVAHDGFDAGQKIQLFKPDLILLDLMMPGMDGFEVCHQLKTAPATKAIRIIGMTGYYLQENINRVLSAGAEACLQKPLDVEVLLDVMGLAANAEGVTHEPVRKISPPAKRLWQGNSMPHEI